MWTAWFLLIVSFAISGAVILFFGIGFARMGEPKKFCIPVFIIGIVYMAPLIKFLLSKL